MMRQHDVDAGTVKLDYLALLETAQIAFGQALQSVRRETSKLDRILLEHRDDLVGIYSTAQYLEQASQKLAKTAETLAALEYGLRRPNVVLVNREWGKEEGGQDDRQHE